MPPDLVLLHASTLAEAVVALPERALVVKGGVPRPESTDCLERDALDSVDSGT
jgi:hypothetical protein